MSDSNDLTKDKNDELFNVSRPHSRTINISSNNIKKQNIIN